MSKIPFEHIHDHPKTSTPPSFLLKFLLELGPLCVFFLANYKGNWLIEHVRWFQHFNKPVFPATALFIAATLIALTISWLKNKTLPVMPLVSGIFVIFFGSLTLWFHNDIFIKMKPTFVDGLFGFILLGGVLFKQPLLAYVFEDVLHLDNKGWFKLCCRAGWFFIFLACLNEIVWRNFSNSFWVDFKVFAVMPLTILFFIAQAPLLHRHALTEEKEN